MGRALNIWLIVCLILLLGVMVSVQSVVASQGSAQNAIYSAKETIKDCYNAVKQAEAAGANVTALFATLNDAATLLSKADLAYSAQNYDQAATFAAQSQNQLGDVISQANAQEQTAQQMTSQNLIYTYTSLVAAIAIFCGGIACWVFLGKKERRN